MTFEDACINGDLDFIVEFLKDGNLMKDDLNMALEKAAIFGQTRIVSLLLLHADPNYDRNSPLRYACQYGHIDIVRVFLQDNRVDPSDGNNVSIAVAVSNGHIDVVELLLQDSRVDPADCTNDAIQQASNQGHLEIVKLLMADCRVNPADWKNYAIQQASINGHIEVVKQLLTDCRVVSGSLDMAIAGASTREIADLIQTAQYLPGGSKYEKMKNHFE